MLTVYIDFKSAGSLLAIDPTLALADELDLTIDWRGFGTAERDIPDSGANRQVVESHQRVRAQSRRLIDQKYARLRGIDLRYPATETRTDLALGVLSELDGDPVPFIRAAFAAYWQGHRDLDTPSVMSEVLSASGARHSGDFARSRAAFETAQGRAEDAGVVDAPAFIIRDQLFIGRQHLPWIAQIAKGGALPAPRR